MGPSPPLKGLVVPGSRWTKYKRERDLVGLAGDQVPQMILPKVKAPLNDYHRDARPAPTPGKMAAPGRPSPESFLECPALPRPTAKKPRDLTVTLPRPEHFLPAPNFFSSAPPQSKKG